MSNKKRSANKRFAQQIRYSKGGYRLNRNGVPLDSNGVPVMHSMKYHYR